MKLKKCKICKSEFSQRTSTQVVCSLDCSILLAQNKRTKSEKASQNTQKRELKAAKDKIKPRSAWMREAQAAFNAYRRMEDGLNRGGTCISCGTKNGKQNCGHYRSVGSSPELRFEQLNTYLQCERCNTFLHSNAIEFRIALTKILTKEQLDWLEGIHPPKKYSVDDLKQIKSEYTQKIKELKSKLP